MPITPPTNLLRGELDPAAWNARSAGYLPGLLGVDVLEMEAGRALGRVALRPEHLAPNGFLHAAMVIALADTLCGYGCVAALPEGAIGFTTVETKSNHLGTALAGAIRATATLAHGGRSTQVWDAEVSDETTGKPIALYRCTQMLLYPRPA